MSKFICRILSRMLQSKSNKYFARKCVKLVVKYHLFISKIKNKYRNKNDYYFNMEAQFA